jgi:predicted negative regulator of RcsB-dependent stress response
MSGHCACQEGSYVKTNPIDPTMTELLIGIALVGGLGLLGYLVYTQNQANQATAQFYQGVLGQIQQNSASQAQSGASVAQ